MIAATYTQDVGYRIEDLIHYRQLIVTGVTGGSPRDFRAAMRLLAAGRIPIDRIVSHRFARAEMARAFDVALQGKAMKVVLEDTG